jgi:hypothetical protein
MRPSGRKASAQGCSSPRATVSTRTAAFTGFGVGERGAWAWPCAGTGAPDTKQATITILTISRDISTFSEVRQGHRT